MYNWNVERKFLSSRSISSLNFTPKSFNCLSKPSSELINYNLPVIKEEEGYISDEEGKSNSVEKLLPETLFRRNFSKETLPSDSKDSTGSHDRMPTARTFTKLPPLVNVNCLMNIDLKQSHHIWDTNFGKRLIQGKQDSLDKIDSCVASEVSSNKTVKSKEKSGIGQPPNLNSEKNVRNSGDTVHANQRKISRKKPKKNKTVKNSSKKLCPEKDKDTGKVKSNENVKETLTEKKSSKKIPSEEILETPSTVPRFPKNRHFLTECVRSILDSTPAQFECEHCKEEFENIEDLCNHRKEHELKKETCLLCNRVFYNPVEFVEHLLSHEGVDRFSCKKCKKYFPNLKKYKQHCREFHAATPKPTTIQNQFSIEYVKGWLPKYECKRCKIELDSEKALEEHKKCHIKIDLAGAYLLSPSNLTRV